MTDPDRVALEAQQRRWAADQQAPPYMAAAAPDHDSELMAAHGSVPSVAQQDKRNGAGLPTVDKGSDGQGWC